MSNNYFILEFGLHVTESSITSMVSAIGSYGNVTTTNQSRQYEIEVFRESHVPKLKQRLLEWDKYGFLKWRIENR